MSVEPIVITVAADSDCPPFERQGEPVAIGVAVPRGVALGDDLWSLRGPRDESVPVQVTALDRWGDGSVRWLLVEFQADAPSGANAVYSLVPKISAPVAGPVLSVEQGSDVLAIRTGAAEFHIPRRGPFFLTGARVDGAALLRGTSIEAEDVDGKRYQGVVRDATLERTGHLTAVVRLDGGLIGEDGSSWLDVTVRLQCFAGLGAVRVEVSVTNPAAARHAGGLWDLGDPGSKLIRDLSVKLTPEAGMSEVWSSHDRADQMSPSGASFAVYQDSSGGETWQHANHVNRANQVPATFRGFRASSDRREFAGDRATPLVAISGAAGRMAVTAPRFWELFPKSLAAGVQECVIGMFPRQYADAHELQGGERSTFTFVAAFGSDNVSAEPLAWARSPLRVSADSESYRHAGAWAPIGIGSTQSQLAYTTLVDKVIAGQHSFRQRRERIDEYGWRNFGEIYADHESVRRTEPMVSHYNNQYDAIAGFGTRFLATGDPRWFVAMDELAAHVADIDLYHTRRDRAAYNGGYFWHTQHYEPAGTATHRAYSRANGSAGGGPSAEHNYTTGLLLHHLLTGSQRSRAAVIQLADWVLDMDDGRKSRFRWIDRRDTGLASATRSPDFHGPGRGAGNSINALLDAHRLTRDVRYLDKADALIARCVHPDDDPESLDLRDVENRWSYTVFLQALGKYLEHRAELGLVEDRYAYARAVLLKYAMWMLAHERPSLESADRLEFPTETWAAQDIRKAAVFEFAARHADDDGASAALLARAGWFFDYAVTTLQAAPTGTLARPLVLLLAYAVQRPMLPVDVAQSVRRSTPATARAPFIPLRQRIVRRLVWAGAGLSAAALFVIALLIS